ncbi:MAG: adenylate/guanylate cyclase domain-containing protein, partial [SAR202 cluster bacterium]|nr:adenylate/guanylate cyclase domain-containing protein [SAR202 cluster bacterium]
MLQYFSNQKDSAMALLSDEQAKSESLLLNVLPAEIAEELKTSDRTIAQHHDAVSVLFADVVGSTSLTVEYEPTRMVEMLNVVFSYFDTLTDKYGLEKIRTIGDNYMVASGVPKSRDDHAVALANMALDMNAYVTQNPAGATPLKFRIGMNTGSVVAGVIGQQKFHYDIWGDSVNTASRMESHGEPGKIQITREMYEALGNGFVCVPRGVVDIKGKGEMETWWLEGRISGNSG